MGILFPAHSGIDSRRFTSPEIFPDPEMTWLDPSPSVQKEYTHPRETERERMVMRVIIYGRMC